MTNIFIEDEERERLRRLELESYAEQDMANFGPPAPNDAYTEQDVANFGGEGPFEDWRDTFPEPPTDVWAAEDMANFGEDVWNRDAPTNFFNPDVQLDPSQVLDYRWLGPAARLPDIGFSYWDDQALRFADTSAPPPVDPYYEQDMAAFGPYAQQPPPEPVYSINPELSIAPLPPALYNPQAAFGTSEATGYPAQYPDYTPEPVYTINPDLSIPPPWQTSPDAQQDMATFGAQGGNFPIMPAGDWYRDEFGNLQDRYTTLDQPPEWSLQGDPNAPPMFNERIGQGFHYPGYLPNSYEEAALNAPNPDGGFGRVLNEFVLGSWVPEDVRQELPWGVRHVVEGVTSPVGALTLPLGPGGLLRNVGINAIAGGAGMAAAEEYTGSGLPGADNPWAQLGVGILAGGGAEVGLRTAPAAGRAAVRGIDRLTDIEQPFAQRLTGMVTEAGEGPNLVGMFGRQADEAPRVPETAYVAPLRPIEEVIDEVVTLPEGSIRRAIASNPLTGWINPSLTMDTPVGRALVAFERQRISADQLSEAAVQAALGKHDPVLGLRQAVGKRFASVFNIGEDGAVRNLDTGGQSNVWQDVFSRPDDYAMSPRQRSFVDDFNRAIEEMQDVRVAAGLREFPRNPDGSLYVPRQVREIRGVELRRPSNPNLQRIHELAAEGVANGVRYSDNPAETLRLYLRATYEEIAQKQLSDMLEPQSITASQLVPDRIKQQRLTAFQNLKAAERAIADERQTVMASRRTAATSVQQARTRVKDAERRLSTIRGELRGREQLASGRRQTPLSYGDRLREAQAEVTAAKAELRQLRAAGADIPRVTARRGPPISQRTAGRLQQAQQEYNRARNIYTRHMESARRAEVAPGPLFGETDRTIAIGQWRNRFFKREDYELLKEYVGGFGGVAKPKPNALAQGFETTGNVLRSTAAVGDFAAGFIQGLPVLARNPAAWSKMMAGQFAAFAAPGLRSRYIANNLEVIQEMAQHGVPIEGEEALAGFRTFAKAGKQLDRLPGGGAITAPVDVAARQTLGRFSVSYQNALNVARTELWKAMRDKMPPDELAEYVRNATGGLDSRALGVRPNQRAFESFWLAFSPRLLRSTVALAADAFQPWTPAGRESLRTIASLFAGTAAAYYAAGKLLDKDDDEIFAGLNPLAGKRFLSYNVNGEWIGVGGQIRALTQLAATAGADLGRIAKGEPPKSVTTLDQYDNPLVRFYTSRGAPAQNIVGGAVEALTGGRANALPYDDINSVPDLVRHLGKSSLPFAVQSILEGQSVLAVAGGFLGLRTSPETPSDTIRREAEARGWDPSDIGTAQREEIFKSKPGLKEGWIKAGGDTRQDAYAARGEAEAAQQNADATFRPYSPDAANWRESTTARSDWLNATQGAIYRDLPDRQRTLADSYYKVVRDNTKAGQTNWDTVNAWLESQPAETQEAVEAAREKSLPLSPLVGEWKADKKAILDSGYWDIRDAAFEEFKRRNNVQTDITDPDEWKIHLDADAIAHYRSKGYNEKQAQLAATQKVEGIWRKYEQLVTNGNRNFRKEHPEIADLLQKWGYAGLGKEEIEAAIDRAR